MKSHQPIFRALTGLRGIGALWVTLFHLFHASGIPALECGYLGVDLFFLMSGFIISHVHARDFDGGYRIGEHLRFLQLRLARIYPLHVVVLVAFGLFVLAAPDFVGRYDDPARLGGRAFVATLFLVNNWGFGVWSLWNLPTWSLSAEWLAYLSFPLVAIVTARIPPKLALAACLLGLVLLAAVLVATGNEPTLGRIGLLRIACEFPAGCLLYRYVAGEGNGNGGGAPRWTIWLALALLVPALGVPALALLAMPAFALLVIGVVTDDNPVTRLCSARPMMRLGDVSFSLYMCHWPLIQVRNWAVDHGYIGAAAGLAAVVVAIVAKTWLCWKTIEVPGRTLGRRLITRPSADAAPGALAKPAAPSKS